VRRAYRDYFLGIKTAGDSTPPRELQPEPDYLGWLAWSADSRTVYGLRLYPERTDVVAVDADTGRSRSIYSASELLMEASWARDARSFVAIRQTSFTPDHLVRIA